MDALFSKFKQLKKRENYVGVAIAAVVVLVLILSRTSLFFNHTPKNSLLHTDLLSPLSGVKAFALPPSNLAGEWDSTFGLVRLVVNDHKVTGTYSYQEGTQLITGTIDGNIDDKGRTQLAWKETNGKAGHAMWQATEQDAISGVWGFDNSPSNGGRWILRRVTDTKS